MSATLLVAIIALVGIAITLGLQYGHTKAQSEIDQHFKDNQLMKSILTHLNDNAYTVINAVQQEIIPILKQDAQDGKLSREDFQVVKDKAIDKLQATLTQKSKEYLNTQLGSPEAVSNLLGTIVEGNLNVAKAQGLVPKDQVAKAIQEVAQKATAAAVNSQVVTNVEAAVVAPVQDAVSKTVVTAADTVTKTVKSVETAIETKTRKLIGKGKKN